MILASSYILNEIDGKEGLTIYPGIHNLLNAVKEDHIFEPCTFPDVNPSTSIPDGVEFSMAAGEFLDVYGGDKAVWDAVATCFFIDTAHNVVRYISAIFEMMKPGALWVNIGPLLYHYSEDLNEISIELSWE